MAALLFEEGTVKPRPRFYFSFRSPYSWLAYHDLTSQHPELVGALDWRPFWEPDALSERLLKERGGRFIYTPMSKEKHLYMLWDIRRLTQRRGLSMTWPVDRDPCWEVAHLAYLAAVDAGYSMAFIERVYRARWQEGHDISDRATIAMLAEEVGVPGERAAQAADLDEMRRRGVEALLAIDRDNVFGVPFFIHRSQKFWGVDRLRDFLHSLSGETALADADAAPATISVMVDAHSADQGHEGGCG
jgi:2-hydroxychromene-2-carboxylate isomerase